MKPGKKRAGALQKPDKSRRYALSEAVSLVKELAFANFDESVDVAVRLGVDPKHADQMVRGAVVLPHGTGKTNRVVVFAKGEKVAEAEEAGADFVGADDLVAKITDGWLDFDTVIATPDMMGQVGRLGRVLGPRGLMPNPKVGTVTMDITKAVSEAKAGRIEYRVDKSGIIHVPIGKRSFGATELLENAHTLYRELIRVKPSAVKGTYVRSVFLSGSMTPSIRIEATSLN